MQSISIVRWLMVILTLIISLIISFCAIGATESTVYEISPQILVVGWDRLALPQRNQLEQIITAIPRGWYSALRVITVDNTEIPEPLASEECERFPGTGPCRINIFSSLGSVENAFPPDDPGVSTSQFVAVTLHELAHQMDVLVRFETNGVASAWKIRLIEEAGCISQHYLRSMLPTCYFQDYPQEFLASAFNQWATCSMCTLRLALTRWDAGISQPLDQVIYLIALTGFRSALIKGGDEAVVVAFRLAAGIPQPELWSVSPWRCGGSSTITTSNFSITLLTDEQCHVTEVQNRQGI